MAEKKKRTLYNPAKFYNAFADDYDRMTGFHKRFNKEGAAFREIVERFKLKSALDAGCGTGFHSFLLSMSGLDVTAVDISRKMLNRMRQNAKALGIDVKMIHSSMLCLKKKLHNKYDSVFCLGNTLANIITKKELYDSIKNFYNMLNPGGILFLQMLNYDRILKKKERIQNIREDGNKIFIRFHDYEERYIRFNVLIIAGKNKGYTQSLNSIIIRPWLASDIIKALHKMKIKKFKIYGSISLDAYKRSSKDLVVIVQR